VTIYKVDCSNHDWQRGGMDLAAMRRDGVDVFIHKATDGPKHYRDPYFAQAMRRGRTAGIPILGAYHVLWNTNVVEQVDWFIDTVLAAAPWAATEPFEWMWDCEPFAYNGGAPSLATINAATAHFVTRLPHHQPLAYCPKWVYASLRGITCPVVASNYGTNPSAHYRSAYPGDTSGRWAGYGGITPHVLQFGSKTTVGRQPTVDANAFRGSLDEFKALIHPGAVTAINATTPASTSAPGEDDDVHVELPPGERALFTSHAVVGGKGWLCLSAAFGDCDVRVARFVGGKSWTDAQVQVSDTGAHWSFPLDGAAGDKVTVENHGPGLLAIDTFADRPWS